MLVTYVDRCTSCACSSLRDEEGQRPLPGATSCGRTCRCHAGEQGTRAVAAVLAADSARFRFWRRSKATGNEIAAVR